LGSAAAKVFNSATAVKPWKRAPTRSRPGKRTIFNSATAVKPWKRADGKTVRPTLVVLQFGHGSEAVETPCPPRGYRAASGDFNSATAVKPWKPRHGWLAHLAGAELQFGHGSEAVETPVNVPARR